MQRRRGWACGRQICSSHAGTAPRVSLLTVAARRSIVTRAERQLPSGHKLSVRKGDLTLENCDAIVNAANGMLSHGGGVAGAIVQRGGQIIQQESSQIVSDSGYVHVGEVVVTGAGELLARNVIHAVGPIWKGGDNNEEALLAKTIDNALKEANTRLRARSVALPAISSGIFGFPKELAARIILKATLNFCNEHRTTTSVEASDNPLKDIRFTNIDDVTTSIFKTELDKLVP